jgi:hypothetical protein
MGPHSLPGVDKERAERVGNRGEDEGHARELEEGE